MNFSRESLYVIAESRSYLTIDYMRLKVIIPTDPSMYKVLYAYVIS